MTTHLDEYMSLFKREFKLHESGRTETKLTAVFNPDWLFMYTEMDITLHPGEFVSCAGKIY